MASSRRDWSRERDAGYIELGIRPVAHCRPARSRGHFGGRDSVGLSQKMTLRI